MSTRNDYKQYGIKLFRTKYVSDHANSSLSDYKSKFSSFLRASDLRTSTTREWSEDRTILHESSSVLAAKLKNISQDFTIFVCFLRKTSLEFFWAKLKKISL